MRALVCTEPGKFEYIEKNEPKPEPAMAVIRVNRIGICGTDLHAFEGTQPFFDYPRILGHELSGELVAIDNDPGFKIGEEVTIIPYFSCGTCIACRNGKPNCCVNIKVFGVHIDGGMVDYIQVPTNSLIRGNGLSNDELALVEPLAIGAHGITRANVNPDEFVLVIGAGPIGLGTMEFARIAGAQVIAMDINQTRLEFCKMKLNITTTVNAGSDNLTEQLYDMTGGDLPTTIIDATGNLKAINSAFQYMAHGGKYVLIGLQKENISFGHPEFHKREGTLMSSRNATRQDFEFVIECIKKGKVKPQQYITHRTSLGATASEFARWVDPGNSVIKAMIELN